MAHYRLSLRGEYLLHSGEAELVTLFLERKRRDWSSTLDEECATETHEKKEAGT